MLGWIFSVERPGIPLVRAPFTVRSAPSVPKEQASPGELREMVLETKAALLAAILTETTQQFGVPESWFPWSSE